MPGLSYYPILVSLGLVVLAYGFIYNLAVIFIGAIIAVVSIYGWSLEPASEQEEE